MSDLHVIAAVFNPAGFESRFRLYRDFSERMKKRGVVFHTVELAIGDQAFSVTEKDNPLHVQVRTRDPIWYKENLINVGVRTLPADWEYVAWIDADLQFARPDWPQETLALLQRHAIVQMFSRAADLDPKYNALSIAPGFVANFSAERHAIESGKNTKLRLEGQPGYAWAARRKEFEAIGGLFDSGIIGGGDTYVAMAMTGLILPRAAAQLGPGFARALLAFQENCETHIRRNVGFVDDMILHYWHGRREDRGYDTRHEVLLDNAFDPDTDLERDTDGLLHLAGNKPALRRATEAFFGRRNEDNESPLQTG